MTRLLGLGLALLALLPATAQAAGSGTVRSGSSVALRETPGGKVLAKIKGGTTLKISCQRNGRTANGSQGRSAVWNKTTYNGRSGFVSDAVTVTPTRELVAGYCNAPKPQGADDDPETTFGACSISAPVALLAPYTDHSKFLKAAIPGARQSDRETRVPAAVTLAQAILESGWGQFSAGGNNFFGIKAQPTAQAGVFDWADIAVGCVLRKTFEEVHGEQEVQIGAFRAYTGLKDSIRDHGARLLANPVYKPAFKYTENDNKFARTMGRFYATSSSYASQLIELMDTYKLRQYDVKSKGTSTTPTTTTPPPATTTPVPSGGATPPSG